MPSLETAPNAPQLVNWADSRNRREPSLADLARAIFPEVAVFAPCPEQGELHLGDMLPLQARSPRSERSERGEGAQAASAR